MLQNAKIRSLFCVILLLWTATAQAGSVSLLKTSVLGSAKGPLMQRQATALIPPAVAGALLQRGASLFAEQGPMMEPSKPPAQSDPTPRRAPAQRMAGLNGLRHLIASVEAGKAGYDAVQLAARIKPRKRPTDMTIGEIYKWIDATPRQQHAIGRYQFIPKTLRRLVNHLGLSERHRFDKKTQDALADQLLKEAGLREFLAGQMSHKSFMNNLAKIWAGLPNSTGKSHYDGYAGNSAGMSWGHFHREMHRIFPRG